MPGIYTLNSPYDTGDNTLPKVVRDQLLTGANGGVRFLFDLAFPWSYPGGPLTGRPAPGPMPAGATIYDMAERANGTTARPSSVAPAYAGGGFDFTGMDQLGNVIVSPADALASIWGAANQYYMVVSYERLPLSADWFAGSGINGHATATTQGQGYQTETELVILAQSYNSGTNVRTFQARRQNGGPSAGAQETFTIDCTTNAFFFGQVTQIAYWRNAAGQGLRLRSALGQASSFGAVGVNNPNNFSAKPYRWGNPIAFGTAGAQNKRRLYRGWVEDLSMSGRDPVAVLDADWARVVARNVFS